MLSSSWITIRGVWRAPQNTVSISQCHYACSCSWMNYLLVWDNVSVHKVCCTWNIHSPKMSLSCIIHHSFRFTCPFSGLMTNSPEVHAASTPAELPQSVSVSSAPCPSLLPVPFLSSLHHILLTLILLFPLLATNPSCQKACEATSRNTTSWLGRGSAIASRSSSSSSVTARPRCVTSGSSTWWAWRCCCPPSSPSASR